MNISRFGAGTGAIVGIAAGGLAMAAGSAIKSSADTNKAFYGGGYGGGYGYGGQDTVDTTTNVVGDTLLALGAGGMIVGGVLGHKAFFK